MQPKNSSMNERPILCLDVDGPLALIGNPKSKDVREKVIDSIPVVVSKRLPAILSELSRHFRIIWSSSWGKRASYKIAPFVGLPEGLPFINFDLYPKAKVGESIKLPGLKAWLKDSPAAIVDDEIGADMKSWASSRPLTLLLEIDPRFGLVDRHLKELVSFADQVRLSLGFGEQRNVKLS